MARFAPATPLFRQGAELRHARGRNRKFGHCKKAIQNCQGDNEKDFKICHR